MTDKFQILQTLNTTQMTNFSRPINFSRTNNIRRVFFAQYCNIISQLLVARVPQIDLGTHVTDVLGPLHCDARSDSFNQLARAALQIQRVQRGKAHQRALLLRVGYQAKVGFSALPFHLAQVHLAHLGHNVHRFGTDAANLLKGATAHRIGDAAREFGELELGRARVG